MSNIYEPQSVPETFLQDWGNQINQLFKNHGLGIGLHWLSFSIVAFLFNHLLEQGQKNQDIFNISIQIIQLFGNIGLSLFSAFLFCEMIYHLSNGESAWKSWVKGWSTLLQFEQAWVLRTFVRYQYFFFFILIIAFLFSGIYLFHNDATESTPSAPDNPSWVNFLLTYALFFNYMIILLVSRLGNLSLSDQIALRLNLPASRIHELGYQLAIQALNKNRFLATAYNQKWLSIFIIACTPLLFVQMDWLYAIFQVLSGMLLMYYASFFCMARTLAYRMIFENKAQVEPQPQTAKALQTIPLL